jgi:hypothetical protein
MKSFRNEATKARALANHYKSKGFKVSSEHGNFARPRMIAGVRPDIVARKGNKVLIIEVKSNATLTRSATALRKLSQFAKSKPGYRFDLVITNPPYVARSSSTGKFVKKSYATKHPGQTDFEIAKHFPASKNARTGRFVSTRAKPKRSKKGKRSRKVTTRGGTLTNRNRKRDKQKSH